VAEPHLCLDPRRAAALRARFDRIFRRRTDYTTLDRLLARLHRRKAELLRILQHPEIPLHTNGSENDIRACVTKRKISGGTMSTAGRTARDVMLGLMKTCSKLGVSFFRYLGGRLHVPGAITILPLPDLVRQAATTVRLPGDLPRLHPPSGSRVCPTACLPPWPVPSGVAQKRPVGEKYVIGAKPRVAVTFWLPPTRASTIRSGHVNAPRPVWLVAN